MDFNADGIDDIISGSYMPGHIYVFEGKGKGEYKKKRELVKAPEFDMFSIAADGSERIDLTASVPFAHDYDADGDLDLIVGNIGGDLFWIPNEGTVKKPDFKHASAEYIRVNGKRVQAGGGDTGPVIADWDGDDRPDLLVGAGDGSVTFFRNKGTNTTSGLPEYEAAKKLISGTQLIANFEVTEDDDAKTPDEPMRSAARAKLCVTDYNGDGRLDLLVGDIAYVDRPAPDLTEEQIARRDELRAEQMKVQAEWMAIFERLTNESDGSSMQNFDFESDPEFVKIQERMMGIYEELEPLEPGFDTHGWVWVYVRKAKDEKS